MYFFFFLYIFLASGGGSPLYPEILQYYTMILQRIRIIVVDAGFEPETSAPEVWRATNEPPHRQRATTSTLNIDPILLSNQIKKIFCIQYLLIVLARKN